MPILIRLAPYLICLLMGAFGAYQVTASHFHAVIAERDLAVEKSISEARQRVIVAVQEQQDITNQTASDYEKRISDIRSKYAAFDDRPAFGMRIEPGSATSMHPISKAASGFNAAPSCDRLSVKLRMAGELQAQQLMSLQDWVEAQEKAAAQ